MFINIVLSVVLFSQPPLPPYHIIHPSLSTTSSTPFSVPHHPPLPQYHIIHLFFNTTSSTPSPLSTTLSTSLSVPHHTPLPQYHITHPSLSSLPHQSIKLFTLTPLMGSPFINGTMNVIKRTRARICLLAAANIISSEVCGTISLLQRLNN